MNYICRFGAFDSSFIPNANESFGVAAPGFFGGDGRSSFENETQHMKIPHSRNLYQKVGMFGMPAVVFFNPGDNGFKGEQIRGFGFLHDGSVDTLFRFHNATVFNNTQPNNSGGFPAGPAGDPLRRQVEAFMMAFDSNLAPIVGQQVTRTSTNGVAVDPRIDLLIARANAGECDLVLKGRIGGEERGALWAGGGQFVTDRVDDPPLADGPLRSLANTAGQELTYSCVPLGSGARIGIDRDGDGFADADEIDAASDPADPGSTPAGGVPLCTSITQVVFKRASINDGSGRLSLTADDLPLPGYSQETVAALVRDGGGRIFGGAVAGAEIVPSGRRFRFRAPSGSTGITRVDVQQNRRSGLFKVAVKTREAWTPPQAEETELTTEVTVNVGGQCFRGNATRVRG